MTDCIFCKIAAGDVPSQRLAESTNFIAILDNFPAAQGHALIIPKTHSTNLLDLPECSGSEWLEFTQRVATAIVATLKADGFNLVLNNGAAAGQLVFHTHFHILPRKNDDGMRVAFGQKGEYGDPAALRERILQHF